MGGPEEIIQAAEQIAGILESRGLELWSSVPSPWRPMDTFDSRMISIWG